MRVARYFPMVVLTSLVCQMEVVRASDSAAIASADEASPQKQGRIVDHSVQQAGFYDSRPRPNSTQISSPNSGAGGRGGPLFRGQSVQLPKSLFGRQSGTSRPSARPPQPAAGIAVPSKPGQIPQRTSNPTVASNRAPQQRSMSAAKSPNVAASNFQNPRGAASRPPMPIAPKSNPQPMPLATRPAPPATNNNISQVSPWTTKPSSPATPAPTATAAPVTAQVAKPAAPLSLADRLVAEAHSISTKATTEQEYSHIIETCRRAQASQASPDTAKYASNLTAWAFNRRGQLKAEAGHDKQAILDFDDAIRADATCWRAVHNRGVLLAQAGQFEKAFDDFSRTIQLNPQFAKAYSNRAALFMVANNLDAARQDYEHAIALDANLAVAHRGCGRVCHLLGHLDQAIGHYDAAVQLAPTDAYAAACRADLLTDIGRYADALAEYDRAIQADPESSQANCGSAWLLATCPDSELRNPQLAVERARQAVEMSGRKDALSYDSLAAAEASAGDFDAAMQSIRKAIELAPADERDAYKERLVLYQQAKPYRIAPVERVAQQASYQSR